MCWSVVFVFFFQAEDGIRDSPVTGVQTCALPIFGNDIMIIIFCVCVGFVFDVALLFSSFK